jgi:hypothetical protein
MSPRRRTAKSVGDKIASVRLMYRFIKDFDTHTKIEGSENLPDWYRLDKKARKDFCRYVQTLAPHNGL